MLRVVLVPTFLSILMSCRAIVILLFFNSDTTKTILKNKNKKIILSTLLCWRKIQRGTKENLEKLSKQHRLLIKFTDLFFEPSIRSFKTLKSKPFCSDACLLLFSGVTVGWKILLRRFSIHFIKAFNQYFIRLCFYSFSFR